MKYLFYFSVIFILFITASLVFPRNAKHSLKSTQYLMEVHDNGYYIECDQGVVGFIPFGNTALDSLITDYNE